MCYVYFIVDQVGDFIEIIEHYLLFIYYSGLLYNFGWSLMTDLNCRLMVPNHAFYQAELMRGTI